MRFLITLALLAHFWAGKAQIYFDRQLDWFHDYEYLSGVMHFGDSSRILVAGGNWNEFNLYDHFFLAQLTATGDTVWQKSFLPDTNASGNTVTLLKLSEKYSILYGNAYMVDENPPNYQWFLIKINNQTGDTIWTRELGSKYSMDGGWKLIHTTDGGFAIAGYSFPVGPVATSNISLLKTDSLGNLIFKKEYTTDPSKNHQAFSLAQTIDGGYVIVGYRDYDGSYLGGAGTVHKNDMIFIRTDAQGNQLVSKTYPPWEWKQHVFYGRDIVPLPDGNFIFAGIKGYALFLTNNTYAGKYFLAKMNADGEFLDSLTLPDFHSNTRTDRLVPINDGNFLAIGTEQDSQFIGSTGVIRKITPDLQVLWKREYRVSPPESLLHEAFWDATEMPDHGFVLAGRAFGPLEDSTWQNAWVIRVDSLGCLEPGCDSVFTAVHDPPLSEETALTLYPNPTDGIVHLSLTEPEVRVLGLRLLDAQGRVIYDVQFRREAGWKACDFDLGAQLPGVYVVQVRTTKGWVVRKIIRS